MPSFRLVMIVKNEAAVIERCLASARPFLDSWCIVDTGSTDDTCTRILQFFGRAGLDGELYQRGWRDFASNRTEAFNLARAQGTNGYLLVLDADDVLEASGGGTGEDGLLLPSARFGGRVQDDVLTRDCYRLRVHHGGLVHERAHVFRASIDWRYEGVVHEYPTCDAPFTQALYEGLTYVVVGGGARNVDTGKFLRDAALLAGELVHHPNDARSAFYLAQSLRDAGRREEALAAYERRILLGGFPEEVFAARLAAARLRMALGEPKDAVYAAFLRAFTDRPTRNEPLVELAAYARSQKDWLVAEAFARAAVQRAEKGGSTDLLFVERDAYTWRPLDELAVALTYTGGMAEARALNRTLLEEGGYPLGLDAANRARIEANLRFCEEKLEAVAPPAKPLLALRVEEGAPHDG